MFLKISPEIQISIKIDEEALKKIDEVGKFLGLDRSQLALLCERFNLSPDQIKKRLSSLLVIIPSEQQYGTIHYLSRCRKVKVDEMADMCLKAGINHLWAGGR